jgi:hypothetical protein
MRRAAYERAKRLNAVPAERPPTPQATIDRMRAEFAPEIERLSALLERDLQGLWCP